jgi:hypothetical protein
MDKKSLHELIACLPEGRTLFHYHRDRYVAYLLEHLVRRGRLETVADLKKSPYAGWLNKPLLRDCIASHGRGDMPLRTLCAQAWCQSTPNTYLLSLGQWGSEKRDRWYQTSRSGLNLVLHLNLPRSHEIFLRDVARLGDVSIGVIPPPRNASPWPGHGWILIWPAARR